MAAYKGLANISDEKRFRHVTVHRKKPKKGSMKRFDNAATAAYIALQRAYRLGMGNFVGITVRLHRNSVKKVVKLHKCYKASPHFPLAWNCSYT